MNKFLKIFSFLLLLAVLTETVSGIWVKSENRMALIEKEEKGNAKEKDTEKEDTKDKAFGSGLSLENAANANLLFILENIYIKYSAYLSLPEIPPEQA
jgi:Na+-transporting methylmalonyl-CoA/oxaloacetate decarboxylase gamma subunit